MKKTTNAKKLVQFAAQLMPTIHLKCREFHNGPLPIFDADKADVVNRTSNYGRSVM